MYEERFTILEVVTINTSVQAENGNFSDPTFQNGYDPRIDLAPFFWPPDMVFTYHPGPLCPSSWPPWPDPTILTVLGR